MNMFVWLAEVEGKTTFCATPDVAIKHLCDQAEKLVLEYDLSYAKGQLSRRLQAKFKPNRDFEHIEYSIGQDFLFSIIRKDLKHE